MELARKKVNGSETPGVKAMAHQVADEQELPPPEMQTPHCAGAARAMYLTADRSDCLFAAKDVCRFVSKLTTLATLALKRICLALLTSTARLRVRLPEGHTHRHLPPELLLD